MVYVGSIINCEMLSAADGSNKDACAGGNSGTDEFSQGAADTSTYPHYAVKNGRRAHAPTLRLDAWPGEDWLRHHRDGARADGADITDVLFLLHTPDMYKDQAADLRDLPMMEYDGKCTELGREGKSCAPKRGIGLDPKLLQATGTVEDKPFKFFLTGVQGVCKVKNATTMTCPIAEQTATGWRLVGDKDVSRNGRGLITTTMVDMKANDGAAGRLYAGRSLHRVRDRWRSLQRLAHPDSQRRRAGTALSRPHQSGRFTKPSGGAGRVMAAKLGVPALLDARERCSPGRAPSRAEKKEGRRGLRGG